MQKEARGKKCSLHRANFITLASSSSSCALLLLVPFSSERGPSSFILGRLLSSFALPTSLHRFTLRYVHCVRLLLRSVISPLLSLSLSLSPVPAFFHPLLCHVAPSCSLSLSFCFYPAAIRLSFSFFQYPLSLLRFTNWLLSISASLVQAYSTA